VRIGSRTVPRLPRVPSLPRPPAAVGRLAPLVLLVLAAAALIVAEFLVFRTIKAVTAVPPGGTTTAGTHHRYALAVIGVAVLPMSFGAVIGGSRPAAAALVVLGIVALAITLLVDAPTLGNTGLIGQTYDLAAAHASVAFYIDVAASVLVLLCGLRLVMRGRGTSRRRDEERETRRAARREEAATPAPTDAP
jgi:hypothetical protein